MFICLAFSTINTADRKIIICRSKFFFILFSALKYIGYGYGNDGQYSENVGLWPSAFNVATKALISVNATCGEGGREEFCRISEGIRGKCGVCDNFSHDPGRKHSIQYAIDSSNRWWQSPSLYYGSEFEFVTIIIDLKQVSEYFLFKIEII